jgi:glycosyltransferase involved in cell wall biosynthesis
LYPQHFNARRVDKLQYVINYKTDSSDISLEIGSFRDNSGPRMPDIVRKVLNSGRVIASWITLRWRTTALAKRDSSWDGGVQPKIVGSRIPHLLLFAWSFPPEINGGVYRPTSLAKYAVRAGWRVTVSAGPLTGQPSAAGIDLRNSLPDTVGIFRALPAPPTSYKLLPKIDGGFQNIVPIARAAVGACLRDRPTVIVASGPPFLTFISANFVAKRFRVPLVLEYRDEWSVHTPRFVTAGAFDKKWERKLLRSASAIVFVTEASRDAYLASIDELDASKCLVIPNGWDPDDFALEPASSTGNSVRNRGKLVISFVGSTGLMAKPDKFLVRFQEVLIRCPSLRERLLVRFTGPKSDESRAAFTNFQNQFPNSIELVDGVPKSEAIAEMRRAGALLLLLDSFYDTTIPGKLYEYLAAGAPILVFGDTGVAADLVRRFDAGLVIPTDDSSHLEAALLHLLEEPGTHRENPERIAWLADHSRSAQAARMLRVLSEVR